MSVPKKLFKLSWFSPDMHTAKNVYTHMPSQLSTVHWKLQQTNKWFVSGKLQHKAAAEDTDTDVQNTFAKPVLTLEVFSLMKKPCWKRLWTKYKSRVCVLCGNVCWNEMPSSLLYSLTFCSLLPLQKCREAWLNWLFPFWSQDAVVSNGTDDAEFKNTVRLFSAYFLWTKMIAQTVSKCFILLVWHSIK